MPNIQPPKGTHDLTGLEAAKLRYCENALGAVAELFGYKEIITPIFEHTDVFSRGTGEGSDVVRKEMYTFLDKGGRSLTLRPEFTAQVARSVISNRLFATDDLPLKFYYNGPLFRYERPQLGRFREFHQFGVEAVGEDSARLDAETIILAIEGLAFLGLNDLTLKVNSLGDLASREAYRAALRAYFAPHLEEMCDDCKERFKLNPLRILDCKVEKDKALALGAPKTADYLSPESERRYYETLSILNDFEIPYVKDDALVRGLDYYSEIVFEVSASSPSGKDYGAVLGGGHYASLLKELGGPDLPGVGFAMGLERLIAVLSEEGALQNLPAGLDIYVIPVGEEAYEDASKLAQECRMYGYKAEIPYKAGKIGPLFKKAARRGAKYALIVGADELARGELGLKNLETAEQTSLKLEGFPDNLAPYFQEAEEGCGCGHSHEEGHECCCHAHEEGDGCCHRQADDKEGD